MSLKNKLTSDESQFLPQNHWALSHEISLRLNIEHKHTQNCALGPFNNWIGSLKANRCFVCHHKFILVNAKSSGPLDTPDTDEPALTYARPELWAGEGGYFTWDSFI